ncbi:MAG: choice-of-anchor B family protein [Wenzhouxiangellaceae bacterium]|nr:choice-of-anchor B family protein [Wenzhouxiangellaceae bacterium]
MTASPRRLLIVSMVALLVPAAAWACFTSERAAVLGKTHPDLEFESLAHHMHGEQPIEYAYKGPAGCIDGLSDIFECSGIELAGWLELPEIGGGQGSDSWGWKDEENGRYYALMGRSNGVAFVDTTDPANPVYLGNLPRPPGVQNNVWADIKTFRNHAFIVADNAPGHGIQVFDLTRLRAVAAPPVTFSMDAHYTGLSTAHNIFINEDTGFGYAMGGETCAGGLHMVDLNKPLAPQSAGCFSADGYTHDVQCVVYKGPDSRYRGREICFASNEDTLTIVDVSDKSAPELIHRHTYNQTGYTHQGWLSEDQRFFITDDELDEQLLGFAGTRTLVFDLQTLDQSKAPAEYIADGLAIDHNQYLVGPYTFQSNYRRGLRVLRIDDGLSAGMTEVAWFDTYPDGDGLGFSGAWNVYPFFDNGTVLVSDINRGLFVLQVTEPEVRGALVGKLFADGFE